MKTETSIGQNTLRFILNSIPIGIYIIDRQLRISWANQRMLRWVKEKKISHAGDKHCYSVIFDGKAPLHRLPPRSRLSKSGRTRICRDKKGR